MTSHCLRGRIFSCLISCSDQLRESRRHRYNALHKTTTCLETALFSSPPPIIITLQKQNPTEAHCYQSPSPPFKASTVTVLGVTAHCVKSVLHSHIGPIYIPIPTQPKQSLTSLLADITPTLSPSSWAFASRLNSFPLPPPSKRKVQT